MYRPAQWPRLATLILIGGSVLIGLLLARQALGAQEGVSTAPERHGQYRLLPPHHEEAPAAYKPPEPTETGTPAFSGSDVTELRRRVATLQLPDEPVAGIELRHAEGVVGPGEFVVVVAYYAGDGALRDATGEPAAPGGDPRYVEVYHRSVPTPFDVVVNEAHPFESTATTTFEGHPALLTLPANGAPATNPRTIRWIDAGRETIVVGYQFADTASFLEFAAAIGGRSGEGTS